MYSIGPILCRQVRNHYKE